MCFLTLKIHGVKIGIDMERSRPILLYIFSVVFIVAAIFVSILINNIKNNSSTDLRARATTVQSMNFYGVAGTYDPVKNFLTVNDLQFEDSTGKTLGNWNVKMPGKFNPAQFPVGSKIKIVGSPVSFQIATKNLTALDISRN